MAFTLNKVLISDAIDPQCISILKEHSIDVDYSPGLSKQDLIKKIPEYDGLVVRSATKVTEDVISVAKKLKIIGRAGVGVDNIDCDAATKNGVLVINAPGGNTLSAAELTCGMIVSLSRQIPQACFSMKSGKWDRKNFMGHELEGKTLAIIGLGRIGREVATRMQSYGMKTIGFDPLVPGDVSITFGVESMELEKIWPLADYITVHVPLIPQTKNMISDVVFSKCPKGVKVVNCARGGVIDEEGLLRALESQQCGGAGLDVYTEEPPKSAALLKLLQHPNVICTPHLGANTVEAQCKVAVEIAQQFVDLTHGKPIHGIVNSPTFAQSVVEANKPWIDACKYIGAIGASFFEHSDKLTFNLTLHGINIHSKLLSTAVVIGMLNERNLLANFINAPSVAKSENIEVSNILDSQEKSGLSHFVRLEVKSGNKSHSLLAAVTGELPILKAIDGAEFTAPPVLTSNLIVTRMKDVVARSKVVEFFVKENMANSVSLSTLHVSESWCAINVSIKIKELPSEIRKFIDFWAQVKL